MLIGMGFKNGYLKDLDFYVSPAYLPNIRLFVVSHAESTELRAI